MPIEIGKTAGKRLVVVIGYSHDGEDIFLKLGKCGYKAIGIAIGQLYRTPFLINFSIDFQVKGGWSIRSVLPRVCNVEVNYIEIGNWFAQLALSLQKVQALIIGK